MLCGVRCVLDMWLRVVCGFVLIILVIVCFDFGFLLFSCVYDGDVGVDFYSVEDVELVFGCCVLVWMGVVVVVLFGMVGLVYLCFGLVMWVGFLIVNSLGIIDVGYCGEIKVVLINLDLVVFIVVYCGD